jgi:hypothetical protein
VSLSNVSGYNANTAGQQTLTVTVNGKTATFTVSVKTTGSITVNLEDSINGVPSAITLSKTDTPASLYLEITGTYTAYAWYLNAADQPVSTTANYTVNAADCPLGKNVLTVEVRTSGGTYYTREITFTVTK